ncbi:hypothetical protein Glove_292g31 [Diversispora epigaea]|uniref:Uncharacterized protein n=1 Tax=Diversispora epigaea TaxID=1348612 RepID=A0A397I522_9GLOM|nr:hypothetical protein Glove_292g31 [Diversispora epigaea]
MNRRGGRRGNNNYRGRLSRSYDDGRGFNFMENNNESNYLFPSPIADVPNTISSIGSDNNRNFRNFNNNNNNQYSQHSQQQQQRKWKYEEDLKLFEYICKNFENYNQDKRSFCQHLSNISDQLFTMRRRPESIKNRIQNLINQYNQKIQLYNLIDAFLNMDEDNLSSGRSDQSHPIIDKLRSSAAIPINPSLDIISSTTISQSKNAYNSLIGALELKRFGDEHYTSNEQKKSQECNQSHESERNNKYLEHITHDGTIKKCESTGSLKYNVSNEYHNYNISPKNVKLSEPLLKEKTPQPLSTSNNISKELFSLNASCSRDQKTSLPTSPKFQSKTQIIIQLPNSRSDSPLNSSPNSQLITQPITQSNAQPITQPIIHLNDQLNAPINQPNSPNSSQDLTKNDVSDKNIIQSPINSPQKEIEQQNSIETIENFIDSPPQNEVQSNLINSIDSIDSIDSTDSSRSKSFETLNSIDDNSSQKEVEQQNLIDELITSKSLSTATISSPASELSTTQDSTDYSVKVEVSSPSAVSSDFTKFMKDENLSTRESISINSLEVNSTLLNINAKNSNVINLNSDAINLDINSTNTIIDANIIDVNIINVNNTTDTNSNISDISDISYSSFTSPTPSLPSISLSLHDGNNDRSSISPPKSSSSMRSSSPPISSPTRSSPPKSSKSSPKSPKSSLMRSSPSASPEPLESPNFSQQIEKLEKLEQQQQQQQQTHITSQSSYDLYNNVAAADDIVENPLNSLKSFTNFNDFDDVMENVRIYVIIAQSILNRRKMKDEDTDLNKFNKLNSIMNLVKEIQQPE